jgi:hypothetical protein
LSAKIKKLEKLKGNVDAQEAKLEEALSSLAAAKAELGEGADREPIWEMLERIIALEDDLLRSYREYTQELEKKRPRKKESEEQPPTQETNQ